MEEDILTNTAPLDDQPPIQSKDDAVPSSSESLVSQKKERRRSIVWDLVGPDLAATLEKTRAEPVPLRRSSRAPQPSKSVSSSTYMPNQPTARRRSITAKASSAVPLKHTQKKLDVEVGDVPDNLRSILKSHAQIAASKIVKKYKRKSSVGAATPKINPNREGIKFGEHCSIRLISPLAGFKEGFVRMDNEDAEYRNEHNPPKRLTGNVELTPQSQAMVCQLASPELGKVALNARMVFGDDHEWATDDASSSNVCLRKARKSIGVFTPHLCLDTSRANDGGEDQVMPTETGSEAAVHLTRNETENPAIPPIHSTSEPNAAQKRSRRRSCLFASIGQSLQGDNNGDSAKAPVEKREASMGRVDEPLSSAMDVDLVDTMDARGDCHGDGDSQLTATVQLHQMWPPLKQSAAPNKPSSDRRKSMRRRSGFVAMAMQLNRTSDCEGSGDATGDEEAEATVVSNLTLTRSAVPEPMETGETKATATEKEPRPFVKGTVAGPGVSVNKEKRAYHADNNTSMSAAPPSSSDAALFSEGPRRSRRSIAVPAGVPYSKSAFAKSSDSEMDTSLRSPPPLPANNPVVAKRMSLTSWLQGVDCNQLDSSLEREAAQFSTLISSSKDRMDTVEVRAAAAAPAVDTVNINQGKWAYPSNLVEADGDGLAPSSANKENMTDEVGVAKLALPVQSRPQRERRKSTVATPIASMFKSNHARRKSGVPSASAAGSSSRSSQSKPSSSNEGVQSGRCTKKRKSMAPSTTSTSPKSRSKAKRKRHPSGQNVDEDEIDEIEVVETSSTADSTISLESTVSERTRAFERRAAKKSDRNQRKEPRMKAEVVTTTEDELDTASEKSSRRGGRGKKEANAKRDPMAAVYIAELDHAPFSQHHVTEPLSVVNLEETAHWNMPPLLPSNPGGLTSPTTRRGYYTAPFPIPAPSNELSSSSVPLTSVRHSGRLTKAEVKLRRSGFSPEESAWYDHARNNRPLSKESSWADALRPRDGSAWMGDRSTYDQARRFLIRWKKRVVREEESDTSSSKKKQKPRKKKNRGSGSDDEDADDDDGSDYDGGEHEDGEAIPNPLILCGPPGSGKSALVASLCDELGMKPLEVHPGERRNGAALRAKLAGAGQSHRVQTTGGIASFFSKPPATGSSSGDAPKKEAKKLQTLIVVEHVDVHFSDEDKEFFSAIKALALEARAPVVWTCEQFPHSDLVREPSLDTYERIELMPPPAAVIARYARTCALAFTHMDISLDDVTRLVETCNGDLRASLHQLQFLLVLEEDSNVDITARSGSDGRQRDWCHVPATVAVDRQQAVEETREKYEGMYLHDKDPLPPVLSLLPEAQLAHRALANRATLSNVTVDYLPLLAHIDLVERERAAGTRRYLHYFNRVSSDQLRIDSNGDLRPALARFHFVPKDTQ